jgi:hypothetical protein
MEAHRIAETLTSEFRTSSEGRWVNLREALSRLGYSPRDVAIGDLFDDDSRQDFGILLTRSGAAFSFDLEYVGKRKDHHALVARLDELAPDKRATYRAALDAAASILFEKDEPRT